MKLKKVQIPQKMSPIENSKMRKRTLKAHRIRNASRVTEATGNGKKFEENSTFFKTVC